MAQIQRIAVYCGSAYGVRNSYKEAAIALGALLAKRGIGLVYGGGEVGLMGAVANATLAAGGEAIGVITQALFDREIGHPGLTDLRVVGSMHERKMLMADLAGAFIALPGGFGTMDEFFEVLTWAQLGIHHKPIALLNTDRFFDPLLALCDHFVTEGFVRPAQRSLILTAETPAQLLDVVTQTVPSQLDEVGQLAARPCPNAVSDRRAVIGQGFGQNAKVGAYNKGAHFRVPIV